MGKRAATNVPAQKTKMAKSNVIAAIPIPVNTSIEPVIDELAPVLELLSQAHDISEPCLAMLKTTVPHCLNTVKDERHQYQTTMVGVIEKIITSVEGERTRAIEGIQNCIADAEVEKATNAEKLQLLTAKIGPIENEIVERTTKLKEAEEWGETANQQWQLEQEQQKKQNEAHAQLLAEKTDFEQVYTDQWQLVKPGTMSGKDWRARNKHIDIIMQNLKKAGIVESLACAIPVALKMKPADRGFFAQKTIDFGEEFINNHIARLTERSANINAEVTEQAQAVAAAEATVCTAIQAMNEKAEELQATKEMLDAAKKARNEAAAVADNTMAKLNEFAIVLDKVTELRTQTRKLSAKFETLKERRPVACVEAPICQDEGVLKADEISIDEEAKTEVPIQ